MNKRNYIYIAISVVCVIAVIVAIFYQVSKNGKNDNSGNEQGTNQNTATEDVIDLEEIKDEFNKLFTNKFDNQGYETYKIKKIPGLETEDTIYSAYTIESKQDGKYDINLNIPVFNVNGDVAATLNATTQSVFADKANAILTGTDKYTIFNVDYIGYLNENVLSLVIKATLKEGDNAERLIVQTYNYDIETGKIVTLNEVLQANNISVKDVNKKIEETITEANKQAEAVSAAAGQNIYKRDLNNAMYVTDNVQYFFVGLDGEIYIVYPYGNSNFTSEIDIVKI